MVFFVNDGSKLDRTRQFACVGDFRFPRSWRISGRSGGTVQVAFLPEEVISSCGIRLFGHQGGGVSTAGCFFFWQIYFSKILQSVLVKGPHLFCSDGGQDLSSFFFCQFVIFFYRSSPNL